VDIPREKNATEDEDSQCGAQWVWTALDAKTRLLFGFFVGQRDEESGRAMIQKVKARLSEHKPLFTSDELAQYATLLAEAYHDLVPVPRTGKPGRPKNSVKVIHEDLDYATVCKKRSNGRVIQVVRRIVFGDSERIAKRLEESPSQTVNTSYVERSNGILRQMDAHLRRKSLTFAKARRFLEAKLALVVAWYNLVRPHTTLSRNPNRTTTPRTPAMAAGIQDHPWTIEELIALAWIV